MVEQIMLDALILLVECLEQLIIVYCVNHSTCLSDWMHTQHWNANIYCLHACSAGQDWADCWSAWAVISHNEVLNWDFAILCQDTQDWCWYQISDVPLVEVCLYHHTFVDLDLVVYLMLIRVVGVNAMSHISGYQEWSLHRLVKIVLGCLLLAQQVVNSSQRLHNDVWPSSLCRFWPTLFMVK